MHGPSSTVPDCEAVTGMDRLRGGGWTDRLDGGKKRDGCVAPPPHKSFPFTSSVTSEPSPTLSHVFYLRFLPQWIHSSPVCGLEFPAASLPFILASPHSFSPAVCLYGSLCLPLICLHVIHLVLFCHKKSCFHTFGC